jgi:2,4-dienoyl-CoA reductase-like NADH-dependent reductase (Old Yellow Enzyme family)
VWLTSKQFNGWPDNVKAASTSPYHDDYPTPMAMTKADIEEFKAAFVAAVQRAVMAGFDVIEIHNAHGYLLHNFISPVTNQRNDEYGGSFENRVRLTLEIVDLTRKTIPEEMPLFLRISATDWLEHETFDSWKLDDTIKLATILADRGVDLIDVSSGGNHPAQAIKGGPGYQAPFAKEVKKAVGDKVLVSTVGTITEGRQANGWLEDGLDMVAAGRWFQKNPGLVFSWADDLDTQVRMPNQIAWAFGGRRKR